MSREERYGTRDLTYSAWHRSLSDEMTYIDVDGCEYCSKCREPLLLIEVAKDVGQAHKPTTVLQRLAKRADLDAICALYLLNDDGEIEGFRTRQVAPNFRREWHQLTPPEFAAGLQAIRQKHTCKLAAAA